MSLVKQYAVLQAIKLGKPDGFLSHGCRGRKLATSDFGRSAISVAHVFHALARLQPANISSAASQIMWNCLVPLDSILSSHKLACGVMLSDDSTSA